MNPKDQFKQDATRMRTEIIHEQAKTLGYLRDKLQASQDEVARLQARCRSLELQLMTKDKLLEKANQDYEQIKLSTQN